MSWEAYRLHLNDPNVERPYYFDIDWHQNLSESQSQEVKSPWKAVVLNATDKAEQLWVEMPPLITDREEGEFRVFDQQFLR